MFDLTDGFMMFHVCFHHPKSCAAHHFQLPGDFQEPMAFLFAAEKLQQDECRFFWSPFFGALDAESTSMGIFFARYDP